MGVWVGLESYNTGLPIGLTSLMGGGSQVNQASKDFLRRDSGHIIGYDEGWKRVRILRR